MAFIGFRMLFPQQKAHESPEAKSKSEELADEPTANIAFVPLAMPSTAGPGAHRNDHQFRFHGASWRRVSRLGHYGRAADYFSCRGGDPVGMLTQFWRYYAAGG